MTEDRNLCTIFNDMCTTDIPFYWSCESVRLPWIAPTLTELVPKETT